MMYLNSPDNNHNRAPSLTSIIEKDYLPVQSLLSKHERQTDMAIIQSKEEIILLVSIIISEASSNSGQVSTKNLSKSLKVIRESLPTVLKRRTQGLNHKGLKQKKSKREKLMWVLKEQSRKGSTSVDSVERPVTRDNIGLAFSLSQLSLGSQRTSNNLSSSSSLSEKGHYA